MPGIDYYEELGVPRTVGESELKKVCVNEYSILIDIYHLGVLPQAYRQAAMKWHPDKVSVRKLNWSVGRL